MSLILLIFILIFFGNVIWLQFRIWILAKRGYHVVEHIGEDNVRRFYYMRPKDQHFDINDGFMLFMPDSITKQQGILKKFDKRLLFDGHRIPQEVFEKLDLKQKETYLKLYEADKKEAKEYYDAVNNLHYYVDAVTLRYGIPTVTYVGTSSEPVNFKTLLLSLRKFNRAINSRIHPEEKMSEVQTTAFSIVKRMIENRDAVLLPAPISATYYVEFENYFIKFTDNTVIITNGKFSYYVWMSIKKTEEMKQIFNRELERRKVIVEKKYDNQTMQNLKSIETRLVG